MTNATSDGIYLDHAATSPLRPEVWAAMEEARSCTFNPASLHAFGRRAHERLEEARTELAKLLGCRRREIYLTGGGTSSDNLAILGFARAQPDRRPRVILSTIEHKACLLAAKQAGEEGAEVRFVSVDGSGTVKLEQLEAELAEGAGRPTLVSIMWANNEVGTVQPMAEIVRLAHEHDAVLHTDAVQAIGKLELNVERIPADMITVTAHKLGGPVGIGLLYCREGVDLAPLTFGGSQEKALWPGTQNPLAAVGFACAARLATQRRERGVPVWIEMRDELARRLRQEIPDLVVHAAEAPERLPHLLSVGIPSCDPAALLLSLDLEGVAVSAGSACSSGSSAGSHVLGAMNAGGSDGYATIRFSFGPGTTPPEVQQAGEATIRAAGRIVAAV